MKCKKIKIIWYNRNHTQHWKVPFSFIIVSIDDVSLKFSSSLTHVSCCTSHYIWRHRDRNIGLVAGEYDHTTCWQSSCSQHQTISISESCHDWISAIHVDPHIAFTLQEAGDAADRIAPLNTEFKFSSAWLVSVCALCCQYPSDLCCQY